MSAHNRELWKCRPRALRQHSHQTPSQQAPSGFPKSPCKYLAEPGLESASGSKVCPLHLCYTGDPSAAVSTSHPSPNARQLLLTHLQQIIRIHLLFFIPQPKSWSRNHHLTSQPLQKPPDWASEFHSVPRHPTVFSSQQLRDLKA